MFSLYFLGQYLEQIFMSILGPIGGLVYVALYLIGIIVSDIPSFVKHKNNPGYNSLGASGGVSAIVFSFILFAPTESLYLMFIPIGIPAFIYGILYLTYSWYQSKNGADSINHDAHFYGAVFGLIFTAVVVPSSLIQFVYQIAEWGRFN
jgi:membrane associated rhomboid family serine protease